MSEKKLDLTKPMTTRSGWPAQLLASDINSDRPLALRIRRPDGSEYVTDRPADGRVSNELNNPADIINVPDKIVRYLNVYDDGSRAYGYGSRDEADSKATHDRIARVRIEFTDGQLDE